MSRVLEVVEEVDHINNNPFPLSNIVEPSVKSSKVCSIPLKTMLSLTVLGRGCYCKYRILTTRRDL